ncbi:MAG: RDD family protein [Flavobacteriia bacterium]|nr:RDD family protein [Flavobacteriia bacterium]
MKTIEDIKIEKTLYRKEKDENGNLIEVPYTKSSVRSPEVVSQGVRFGYYLIDLVIYYILSFIVGFVLALTVDMYNTPDLLLNVIAIIVLYVYYVCFEGFFGATIGKMILGYSVIDQYAEKPAFTTIMLRTVCRLVPFEAFSCLGERGWHDQWSKTYVVRNSEKAELRKLLGKMDENNDLID